MTINRSDYDELQRRRGKDERARTVEQQRLTHLVGVAASELVSDPRWNMFCEHVESLRQRHDSEATAAATAIVDDGPNMTDAELRGAFVRHARHRGRAAALTDVLNLVSVLVNRGEKAFAEMTQLTRDAANEASQPSKGAVNVE